jgi:plasmid stabilization system protein ParE
MAAALTWTDAAVAQLDDIAAYIAQDSPRHAARTVERIVAAAEGLARFPFQGRVVPEFERDDLREVFWRKYRVIYRTARDAVRIIAVIHGARRLTDLLDDEDVDA